MSVEFGGSAFIQLYNFLSQKSDEYVDTSELDGYMLDRFLDVFKLRNTVNSQHFALISLCIGKILDDNGLLNVINDKNFKELFNYAKKIFFDYSMDNDRRKSTEIYSLRQIIEKGILSKANNMIQSFEKHDIYDGSRRRDIESTNNRFSEANELLSQMEEDQKRINLANSTISKIKLNAGTQAVELNAKIDELQLENKRLVKEFERYKANQEMRIQEENEAREVEEEILNMLLEKAEDWKYRLGKNRTQRMENFRDHLIKEDIQIVNSSELKRNKDEIDAREAELEKSRQLFEEEKKEYGDYKNRMEDLVRKESQTRIEIADRKVQDAENRVKEQKEQIGDLTRQLNQAKSDAREAQREVLKTGQKGLQILNDQVNKGIEMTKELQKVREGDSNLALGVVNRAMEMIGNDQRTIGYYENVANQANQRSIEYQAETMKYKQFAEIAKEQMENMNNRLITAENRNKLLLTDGTKELEEKIKIIGNKEEIIKEKDGIIEEKNTKIRDVNERYQAMEEDAYHILEKYYYKKEQVNELEALVENLRRQVEELGEQVKHGTVTNETDNVVNINDNINRDENSRTVQRGTTNIVDVDIEEERRKRNIDDRRDEGTIEEAETRRKPEKRNEPANKERDAK